MKKVHSDILNEIIYFANDTENVSNLGLTKNDIVYRRQELIALIQAKPDAKMLTTIHEAKRIFNGSIINKP